MIVWIFASLTLCAVLGAAFMRNMRRATIALWLSGLGAGGVYLTIGAETLAIIQWIVSTLVAISFVFFAVMFGEYSADDTPSGAMPSFRNLPRPQEFFSYRNRGIFLIGFVALVVGISFAAVVWYGAGRLPESALVVPTEGNDLAALGRALIEEHLLSLEVLALTLFLVLVGGGVVARPAVLSRKGINGEEEVETI